MEDMNLFWVMVIVLAVNSTSIWFIIANMAELCERIEKLEKGQ